MREEDRAGNRAGKGAEDLERYRSLLLILARTHLDRRIQAKVPATDVVQKTLIAAHRAIRRSGDGSGAGRLPWLRKVLARMISRTRRDLRRDKRDLRREISLDQAFERSTAVLRERLADPARTPSEQLIREELLLRLSDVLLGLPEGQMEAILLHFLEGLSLAEVGERIGRTEAAAAGLLRRGLKTLRETTHGWER